MEVIATTCLKLSDGFSKGLFTVLCLLSYGLCYFLFSKSIQTLDLGLAYAIWCGVGIICTTCISLIAFGEKLNAFGILGIAMIILGCIVLQMSK